MLTSLVNATIIKRVMTGLSDQIRDALGGMGLIKVRPFLDLNLERHVIDFKDTNGGWVSAVVRKSSHDDNRPGISIL
jgi:hypothetical protein